MPPEMVITSDSDMESVELCKDLQIPGRRNSKSIPKYFCKICGASYIRLDHLDRHEFHHTGIKKHICTYDGCTKSYTILTHLKRHFRTTHERSDPPNRNIKCVVEGCEKMFTSLTNMNRHLREVHENPKIYHCGVCGAKFTQKLKMRRHEIQNHTGIYPYTCTKCDKGFYQQWNFDRHVKVCKIYPCPDCSLLFDKWSLYLKHCKETQHGRKYYKCEHCDRLYGKPGELKKHIDAKHVDDANKMVFECTFENCERSYVYQRNLRQHIRIAHSGERFNCKRENCNRDFSSIQNLKKHIERDHNPNKNNHDILQFKDKKISIKRKKRKDAGKSIMSHLSKLSGLAVDKEFDKLLREREETALNAVSFSLSQEMPVTDEDSVTYSSDKSIIEGLTLENKEKELNSLLAVAFQDEIN